GGMFLFGSSTLLLETTGVATGCAASFPDLHESSVAAPRIRNVMAQVRKVNAAIVSCVERVNTKGVLAVLLIRGIGLRCETGMQEKCSFPIKLWIDVSGREVKREPWVRH